MTIQKLIDGEHVNCLQVNILKELSATQYIVGDTTGIAILTIDEGSAKFVEVGKGLRMVKPSKVDENNISTHPKFSPQKMKAMLLNIDDEDIERLSTLVKGAPVKKGINFSQIDTEYGPNAVINEVLAYVTSASRIIEGKYGTYQICNLVDFDGNSMAINLYKSNINKLEVNKAYRLEKIKKTTIKSEDGKLRMATTNFSAIKDATQSETDLFKDVKIADKKLQGTCMMFNNLNLYKSCSKHLLKLDESGNCGQCDPNSTTAKSADFRCSLIIENPENEILTEIAIFKRHLKLDIDDDCIEETLIEMIEEAVVGKECEIHYNENGTDNNVAVKLTVMK